MNDIKKEQQMVLIITLAGISCILQNHFGNWDFWVPWIIAAAGLFIWWLFISKKTEFNVRTSVYFVFAAFLAFYHGIHEVNLFDVSTTMGLLLITFTLSDRVILINLALIEYAVLMFIQYRFIYLNRSFDLDAFTMMRLIFHMGTVIVIYFFGRATIGSRKTEKERVDKWQESVNDNKRDMEDFLSNISHEIRTPVNVISGMSLIMKEKNDCDELESIQQAGLRLAHQIEDIQDYTEIKRGELILEEDNYMCTSLVNDIVAGYKSMDRSNNLELVIDLDPNTPNILRGDIQKIHKLFRHLYSNAIKFTAKGGIYIKVFAIAREYGVNLTIEVTDTGIGMDRAAMASVSKGMYQANKKRNRSTGGIGIGLPIVYGFVHKMGGFVKIDSAQGKGTTVRLSIPQEVVDPSPCLAVDAKKDDKVVFYMKPEKYRVPEVREFYREMAVNMANGLGVKLYVVSEKRELEGLIKEITVSHIFTGHEEFETDRLLLEGLAKDGSNIVICADKDYKVASGKNIRVMPRPLYAFPVVRILNGIEEDDEKNTLKRLRFTGVSALIVDDEPMNLVVAKGLLKDYKMYADTAESGREAIEKYKSGSYDVIFMDHMMPEMDGVEAMKCIRREALEIGKSPAIVALTANALSGAKEMFIKEGFDGFIAKPIDIGEFERVMKHVLPEDMIRYEEG